MAISIVNTYLILKDSTTSTLNVILRNVNHFKRLKTNMANWGSEMIVLAVIALELELQVLLGNLLNAYHRKHEYKNITNEDKKIQECYLEILEAKKLL